MKALFVTELGNPEQKTVGKLELKESPVPDIGDEEVLIKVKYASICGSDGHMLRGQLGEHTKSIREALPLRIGHEVSGVIEKVGKTAEKHGLKPGNRVTGNFTQFCGSCLYCRTGRENFCEHPI